MTAGNGQVPAIRGIDHVHVFVADRAAAVQWYQRVLGMTPVAELAFWAPDGGPLTIADAGDTVHLALFERPAARCRSTIALRVDAAAWLTWRDHLTSEPGTAVEPVDHQVAWSLYFSDPDGNPFEITSYDYAAIAAQLG
jgi:catechol-2,3-dioxygenase